ncbi:hypothetical protein OH77DRAFT_1417491 [Trametes cingulata]|nr:hypothetical protein OH77DRAFT_1417491 [Trametes cingulata]
MTEAVAGKIASQNRTYRMHAQPRGPPDPARRHDTFARAVPACLADRRLLRSGLQPRLIARPGRIMRAQPSTSGQDEL